LDPVFQQEGEGLAGGGGVWLRHRQPGQREGARPAAQPPGATALTPLSIVTEPRTDLEPAPPVRIDPARLERIVTDLLDNAVRHGAPPIVVTTDTASGYVQLTVHDAAPGMPAQFLPHAAERFARADTARTISGTALGLSLVDAIVAAHGHLRWCSGTAHHYPQPVPVPCTHPGAGTTITVLLPAAPTSTSSATGG
jgi:signal transduction histidine kinase